jgi:hypothetical protein
MNQENASQKPKSKTNGEMQREVSFLTFMPTFNDESDQSGFAINFHDLKEQIAELLPDHHYWQGCLYQFTDSSVTDIMEQIIWSGFLDCTVPNAMYTLSLKVQNQPFGMTTVKIMAGYVADLMGGTKYLF